jgi:hypothetical protein
MPPEQLRFVKVILTVAYYPDHDPMNCADDNLHARYVLTGVSYWTSAKWS